MHTACTCLRSRLARCRGDLRARAEDSGRWTLQGCACDSRFLNLANTFGGTPPSEVVAGAPTSLCAAVVDGHGLRCKGCSTRALCVQATACCA